MKPQHKLIALALAAALCLAASSQSQAAVPLTWEVKPGQAAPVAFDRFHGESLHLTAEFVGFGEPPFAPGADVRLWYQTNGMGSAWWSAPASIESNRVSAVWSPELDPGAERVNLFFGAPSNAYCSAVLRLRGSPGMVPNVLPLPVQRLDYAAIEVANAPYYTRGETDARIVELAPNPTEVDPTVPSWAKASAKPSYTADEVGAVATVGGGVIENGALEIVTTGPNGRPLLGGNTATLHTEGLDVGYGRNATTFGIGEIVNKGATIALPQSPGTFALTSDVPDVSGYATLEDLERVVTVLATNLVDAVIKQSTYNLTWDAEAHVMWRKVARNGAFYEECYTNVNVKAEGGQ